MTMPDKSDAKRKLVVKTLVAIATVLVVLIIAIFISQKLIPSIYRCRSKRPILPVTNIPPRKNTFQRRLEALRLLCKPVAHPASRPEPQSNATEMTTLTKPLATRSPQRRPQLTHREWFDRYHTRKSPHEEERRRKLQEQWKPRVFTQEYTEHWKRVAEEQKARRTLWEKMKDIMGV
jgi:hypothetical protein